MEDIIGMAVSLVMMTLAVPGTLLVVAGILVEAYDAIEQFSDEEDDE
jgi:quinol-cytochrome oxidoreductase complex cytochrome b subunit